MKRISGSTGPNLISSARILVSLLMLSVPAMAMSQESISNDQKASAFERNVTLLGIQPATVAPAGLAFASLAWTDKRDGIKDEPDGSAALGLGIGVGDLFDLQFTANITSLENDFGDSGFFDIRASRQLGFGSVPTFLGLGVTNVGAWGDADTLEEGVSAAITAFPVVQIGGGFYPLMLTLGGGTEVADFGTEPGALAGIGIGLTEAFGTSVAYNGDNVDIGASFRIPGVDMLGFNVILSDAFNMDDRQRVVLSLNWIVDNVF